MGVATVGSGTGSVSGIAGGTAGITYTLSTGCNVNITVTVNPVSPITGTTAICTGTSVTLANAITGGTWISGILQ